MYITARTTSVRTLAHARVISVKINIRSSSIEIVGKRLPTRQRSESSRDCIFQHASGTGTSHESVVMQAHQSDETGLVARPYGVSLNLRTDGNSFDL